MQVIGLTNGVTAITAGEAHACAVTAAGAARCWGHNDRGQLGDGTLSDSTTPVQVRRLTSGVTAITAADYHTCALTSAGTATCWGYNRYGQLGNGTRKDSTTPVIVAGSDGRRNLARLTARHTRALA